MKTKVPWTSPMYSASLKNIFWQVMSLTFFPFKKCPRVQYILRLVTSYAACSKIRTKRSNSKMHSTLDLLPLERIYLVVAQLRSVLNDSVMHSFDKELKTKPRNASN